MKKHLKRRALSLGCVVCAGFAMISCIDSNYDLANLNKEIQFNFNELVIPLNLDTIKLKQLIKIKDDDIIQLDTLFDEQGQIIKEPGTGRPMMMYVAKKEDTFSSQAITFNSFTAPATKIQPVQEQIDLTKRFDVPSMVKNGRRAVGINIPSSPSDTIAAYLLSNKPTFFNVKATNIDSSLVNLTSVQVKTTFTIPLTISNLTSLLHPIHFTNFKLQLPSGLIAKFYIRTDVEKRIEIHDSKYDEHSGILTLDNVTLYADSSKYATILEVEISKLEGINETWGSVKFDDKTRELEFSNSLRIVEGSITICMKDFKAFDPSIEPCIDPTQQTKYAAWENHYKTLVNSLPKQVTYASEPKIDDLIVDAFSGEIQYKFKGLNVDSIPLNILDMLTKKGTDIYLNNPQLYITINNPFREKGLQLTGTSGFSLQPVWEDGSKKTCSLNKDTLIVMDKANMEFMLSPKNMPYKKYPYNYAQHVPFTSLSELLANDGRGLPRTININFENPGLPRQAVTDFPLGTEFDEVEGEYFLFAPLQLATLGNDSTTNIVYEDSVDINDDIFNDLYIEELSLDFTVDNEIPLEIELYLYPKETINGKRQRMTDEDGEEICFEIDGVIEALAKAQDVEAVLTEAIPEGHVLTGIDFEAYLRTEDGTLITIGKVLEELPTLVPEMGVKMSDLKIKVSGYYNKKL